MRRTLSHLIVASALIAGLATTAEAQTKTGARTPARTQPAPTPPPHTPGEQLKTSDEVQRESVGGAVTTPLRDLNVARVDIPDVLLQAISDPYARPPRAARCSTLIALVRPLDDALGPDIDQAPPPPGSPGERGKGAALETAADLASGALIPFRGVVRMVTGAEGHDRLVQQAILAGHTRRAYLKGLGEAKGCPPPATPTHERTGSSTVVVDRRMPKPKYPTR